MKISCFTGGLVQTNGYLIETAQGNFLVDAPAGVTAWLAKKCVEVTDVLLTHQHYDHVEDAAALQKSGARLHAFADYSEDLTLEAVGRAWGMPIVINPYQIDCSLATCEPIEVAGTRIHVAHVPGHARDGLIFHLPDEGVLFSGDTLFAGSIGRADLPGGNPRQLLEGIARHVMTLPPQTRVLSGHGPETTIERESVSNPYL